MRADRRLARGAGRGVPLVLVLVCACGGPGVPARDASTAGAARTATALDPADDCGVITGYELTLSGIGALRVGRSAAEIRRVCAVVRDDTTEEGAEDFPSRVLTVRTPHGNADVLVDSGRVSAVSVAVPTLRTSDSLGVGTTLGRLLRIDGTLGGEDAWGLFVAPGGRCGLNCSLAYDVPNQRPGHAWSADELALLPPGIRVRKVYATGDTCPGGTVSADSVDDDPRE